MREVSEEDLERVSLDRDLHFDSIFGDRLRIVIPLGQDERLGELVSELEGRGYVVDHETLTKTKTVHKRVETRQGEKLRPEKVGKALQSAGLTDLLDWWQKNADGVGRSDVGSSIVISRSPIDVLRMSDHDGISSCHSPDGSFYKCARQEARTGGAVAYVVKNTDLRGVDVQEDEIFEDKDRRVRGIVPLERLRLRRFTKGSVDLLVPELRTYGIKNVGFASAVGKWARRVQDGAISKIDPEADYAKFELRGGSYQDNDADKVWSNFFGVSVAGRKSSRDEDEEDQDESGDVYERAQEALDGHNWTHASVDLNEEGGYLYYTAYISLLVPKRLFASKEVRDALDGRYRRSLGGPSSGDSKIVDEIREIMVDGLEIDGLEREVEVRVDGDDYSFGLSFTNDAGYDDQLTNFERFLDYVDEVDGEWGEKTNKVHRALMDAGYLKDVSEKVEFKNFKVESGDEDIEVSMVKPERVGHLKDFMAHRHHFGYSTRGEVRFNDWNKQFAAYLNRYRALPFTVGDRNVDLFMRKGETVGADKDKWKPASDNQWHADDVASMTGWVYMDIRFDLGLDAHKSGDMISRLKYMDAHWDFYLKKVWRLFDKFSRDMAVAADKSTMTPPKWNTAPHGDELLAGGSHRLGIKPLSGPDARGLSKKPVVKDPQMRLGLKFKEWLYHGVDAPDNDPLVAARGRFLALRQRVMGYVDELEGLGVPASEARERVMSAFGEEIAALPDNERLEMERLVGFLTGMIYRDF